MSVLVFDESTALSVTEVDQPEVLVFGVETGLAEVAGDGDTEFLIFDTQDHTLAEVESVPDFLLIDGQQATVARTVDDLDDLLVFSAPPGERGPQGVPGPGAVDLQFTFAIPTTLWVMTHNLGTQGISVESVVGGEVVDGDVQYVDDDTITVEWYYPMSGLARLFK